MFTYRFISLLAAISLLAVVVLFAREANASMPLDANVDSATRSYTAWIKAAEAKANTVDSAARSYIAQAKAVTCNVNVAYGLNLDSATRSYVAWGLALQANNHIAALCR